MVGLGHGAIWAALIFGALILLVMVATLLQRRTMARGATQQRRESWSRN